MRWKNRKAINDKVGRDKEFKTNVIKQKLLEDNNDTEEWRTQLETRLMKMKVNNVGRLE